MEKDVIAVINLKARKGGFSYKWYWLKPLKKID